MIRGARVRVSRLCLPLITLFVTKIVFDRKRCTMYKIGEIAKLTGVSIDTIRHYTHKGLLVPERDDGNGYQLFSKSDMLRLRFILQAKRLGFTLKEIDEILAEANHGCSPCPRVREIIEDRIEDVRKKIEELNKLRERMEKALQHWSTMPDGLPDGQSVCHLIEGELN